MPKDTWKKVVQHNKETRRSIVKEDEITKRVQAVMTGDESALKNATAALSAFIKIAHYDSERDRVVGPPASDDNKLLKEYVELQNFSNNRLLRDDSKFNVMASEFGCSAMSFMKLCDMVDIEPAHPIPAEREKALREERARNSKTPRRG